MGKISNQELVEKAAIVTGNFANAGKLNDEQSDKFLDYVFDETQLKSLGVRTVKFRNEKMLLEKLNVANRVAVPADEAADPGLRRGISTSKIELQPKEIMVPFELGDLVKDENIEGDKIEETIIRLMATRLGNNIEELYIHGNSLGPAVLENELVEGGSSTLYRKDRYLGLFDGLLAQAEGGHTVDAQNQQIKPTLISRALRAMPNKFRKDRRALKALLSWDHEQHYREGVSTRATGAGDSALAGTDAIPSFGVDLMPVSLMESNPRNVEHVTLTGTTPVQLKHTNIEEVVVTVTAIDKNPIAAFVPTTDYVVDAAAGTIARAAAGGISSGQTVKVTYRTGGRLIITMPKNIVVAIGRDITIERDRNIFKRVNEFAIHAKVFITYEELDAVVLLKNILVPS